MNFSRIEQDFSESKFKSYVDNVFVQIHTAIMTKDLAKIDHFVSDEVYSNLNDRVELLKNNNQTQMFDELNVKQTSIVDFEETDDSFLIKVNITSRYMDYMINVNGDIINGHDKFRIEKENYLTFERKRDYCKQGVARKCEGCGSNIDVNRSGKCEYCGTIYNLEEKDWVVVKFETV